MGIIEGRHTMDLGRNGDMDDYSNKWNVEILWLEILLMLGYCRHSWCE